MRKVLLLAGFIAFSINAQEAHQGKIVTTSKSGAQDVESTVIETETITTNTGEMIERSLTITPWIVYQKNKRGVLKTRSYIWVENGKEVRSCEESAFLSAAVKKALGHETITSQVLASECDFLTLSEKGWMIAPNAYPSRRAYLVAN